MNKNIVLARPNLFIVNEMKRLMEDSSFTPVKINDLSELGRLKDKNISGVVISTSLNSPVGASYGEVINRVRNEFPNKPILLASMIDVDSSRKSIELNLKKDGLTGNLVSMAEASKNGDLLKESDDMLILEKSDITNSIKYPGTKKVIGEYFK